MAGNEILAVGDEAQATYDSANPTPVPESNEAAAADAPVSVPAGHTTGDPATDNSEANGKAEKEDISSEVTDSATAAADEPKHFWGDMPVEVEVPQEIAAALAEHKIDANKLVDELFAKDGKFELSADSRKALDKAFGKTMVDGYINLFKGQNQSFVEKHQAEQQAIQESIKANATDFDTLVGGDEGWQELGEWASTNLTEQEIAHVNAVMQLPVEHYAAQRTVIEALRIKQQAARKETDGDDSVTLLSDSGSPAGSVSAAVPNTLSREQFHELMWSEKYRNDPKYAQAVDEARRRGQKAEKGSRR